MANRTTCPHCGSRHIQAGECAEESGAVLGALSGAAILVWRVVGRASPVAPAAILTCAVIGLLWGAKAGQVVGSVVDDTFPQKARCLECGAQF